MGGQQRRRLHYSHPKVHLLKFFFFISCSFVAYSVQFIAAFGVPGMDRPSLLDSIVPKVAEAYLRSRLQLAEAVVCNQVAALRRV